MADNATQNEVAIAALTQAEALIHSDVPVYQLLPAIRAALTALRSQEVKAVEAEAKTEVAKVEKIVTSEIKKVEAAVEAEVEKVIPKKAPAKKDEVAPAATDESAAK